MLDDLRAHVRQVSTPPSPRPQPLVLAAAGLAFAAALAAAWVLPGLMRGKPVAAPAPVASSMALPAGWREAPLQETVAYFTNAGAITGAAQRITLDAPNPFPPMQGPWGGNQDLKQAAGAEAVDLLRTHRFAELEALYQSIREGGALLPSGEPRAAAFFAPFLEPGTRAAEPNDVAAYRSAFPDSPAALILDAALQLQAVRDAQIKPDRHDRQTVRGFVDFLEAHREELRAEPLSAVLWIELFAGQNAQGSVRTELERAARTAPRYNAPFAAAIRYMQPELGWSPEAMGDIAMLTLQSAPEDEALSLYARVNLELASVLPRRLYTDTFLDRDRFHAGLIDLLNRHPDPENFDRAARVACENKDLYLARLLVHRLEVVPEALIDWDPQPGSYAYPDCRSRILKTYGAVAAAPEAPAE